MNKLLGDKFKGVQHIGIPVSNLMKSKAFYEKLGFDCVMRSKFPYEDAEGEAVMMQRGPVIMELYQMPEPELSEIRKREDGHIDHIAFDVNDIDAVYDELKQAGFNMIEDSPVFIDFWENGCKYFNVLGPDNERLEFDERL
jgi:catechol 2,3-dioxygenase-like lactoylglutathione lyase family enzyme